MSQITCYQFGTYRLDPVQGVLLKPDGVVSLQPKTSELLRVFLNHAQRYLPIDFLLREVWRDDALETDEGVLDFQVSTLRRKLGDNSKPYQFIETRRKRGVIGKAYRFLMPTRKIGPTGQAAECYEKARHFYHKSTGPDLLKALAFYEQVIELQGDYVADAYAGIAESFVLLGTFAHQMGPATEAMRQAKSAALHALALDPQIAEAHSALASIAALHDWDWGAALSHFGQALRLPSNPLVKPMIRSWYALCLASRGESDNARAEIERAKADYPSSFTLAALGGRIAYLAHDPAKAVAECDESIALEDRFYLSYLFKGHALRFAKQHDEAMKCFARAAELSGDHPVCLAEIGHLHGIEGRLEQGRAILSQLDDIGKERYVSRHLLAQVRMGLGDLENAMHLLFDVLKEREAYLIFLATDPVYDPLRAMPGFSELLRKVGY